MKVLHVITRLIVGGAQENTVTSVLGLGARHSIDAQLITGPTSGPEGSLEDLFCDQPDILHNVPNLIRPVSPTSDFQAYQKLVDLFRTECPDIVHTHSGKAGILGRLAAKRARVPVIIHGIHGPSFGAFQGPVSNLIFTTAERLAGKMTSHFVSVADAMTQQYLRAGIGSKDDYSRVFSGFDLAPFSGSINSLSLRQELGLRKDSFVFGKIARLFELKGHDALFSIAPKLIAANSNIQFLLVGDGILRDQFTRRISEKGLNDHFVFSGLVPPSEIPSLVGAMDAVVHLSEREGLPRALAQGAAAGKPLVSYDLDGAPEICIDQQTGRLIRHGDEKALNDAMLELSENTELSRQLGQQGRDYVKDRFSVERMVDDLAAIYERLLNTSRDPEQPNA